MNHVLHNVLQSRQTKPFTCCCMQRHKTHDIVKSPTTKGIQPIAACWQSKQLSVALSVFNQKEIEHVCTCSLLTLHKPCMCTAEATCIISQYEHSNTSICQKGTYPFWTGPVTALQEGWKAQFPAVAAPHCHPSSGTAQAQACPPRQWDIAALPRIGAAWTPPHLQATPTAQSGTDSVKVTAVDKRCPYA